MFEVSWINLETASRHLGLFLSWNEANLVLKHPNIIIMAKITSHHELEVYQVAFQAAMQIHNITKSFPREERYSLTDQIRRSSRSVCANTAEGFRKRRYEAAMIAKWSDAETEAAETKVWLDFAFHCGYIHKDFFEEMDQMYSSILRRLLTMISNPQHWVLQPKK